jgi:hypothetical protein
MEERDLKILRHIGLYRLTLRCVLEHLIFEGASCANVLNRLKAEGYIQTGKLHGNLSYYLLTERTASDLGLPLNRGRHPESEQALNRHVAILWFCCMLKSRSYRLESEQICPLFPVNPPTGDHCIEGTEKRTRIYHLYVPGHDADNDSVLRQIRKTFRHAMQDPTQAAMIKTRSYAFAILVDTDQRRKALRGLLERTMEDGEAILALACIRLLMVPGCRTLHQHLKREGED